MSTNRSGAKVPSYRRHKPSGQAVVTLDGKDIYLGRWDTQASHDAYERVVGEWLANGRSLPSDNDGLTVAQVALRFYEFAKCYYRKNGQPTSEVDEYRLTIRQLRQLYGATLARDFGPLKFKAVRKAMIGTGLSRGVVNHRMARLRRIFKWAVSEELIPPSVYHGLAAVEGLAKGRSEVRECEPVEPVTDEVVEATLAGLQQIPTDMVRFQRYTGCRPAEVCILRPCDVDRTGDVWVYRPESHKTEHHDRVRVICIGPKAQAILRPYLLRPAESYCFSPIESEQKRGADAHSRRRTPLTCGNHPGRSKKAASKRTPRGRYTTNSYRRAIHRAIPCPC